MADRLSKFLGPYDRHVAERQQGPPRVMYPAFPVAYDRTRAPMSEQTFQEAPTPERDTDEYALGKPFPFPGMAISFVSSIKQWEDPLPMGFVHPERVFARQFIAAPRGAQEEFGASIDIDPPPYTSVGALYAHAGYDYSPILGIGGPPE